MIERATINRIIVRELNVPFTNPFQISGGVSYSRKSYLIELHSEGYIGYGESAPFEEPFYSADTLGSVLFVLKNILIPRISNIEFNSIEAFNEVLRTSIRGNEFAIAGLETAYWDLIAKKNSISLVKLINEKLKNYNIPQDYLQNKQYVESGVSIGIPLNEDLETLEKDIISCLEQGYRRIKIKIRPGWDVEPIKLARSLIPNNIYFWPDANGSYNYYEHYDIFKEIDSLGCTFIEQPLYSGDIYYHKRLNDEFDTPICFDESLTSSDVAQAICDMKGPDIWNVKLQRVGGMLEAIKIYAIAAEHGVELWSGTMPESGVGAAAMLALAGLSGFVYPSCVEPSSRWFGKNKDIIEIEMNENGLIEVPTGVGLPHLNNICLKENTRVVFDSLFAY